MHASHAIVKPAGTGTPRFVISARFAPLPPSTSFMSPVPSAPPSPKKYTDLLTRCRRGSAATAEAELVGVGGWRGGVITGEACVAKACGAMGKEWQMSSSRQEPGLWTARFRPNLHWD